MNQKKGYVIWTILLTVIFFAVGNSALAETYYVSSHDGSDTFPGNLEAPWKSLTHAVNQLSDSDTLYVRGGTYREAITVKTSKVTILNYRNEIPILDGGHELPSGSFPNVLYSALLRVTGSNVVVDGIKVTRSKGIGISLEDTKNSIAKNCEATYNLGSGIKIGRRGIAGYNTIDGCTALFNNHSRDNGAYAAWSNIGQNISIKGGHNTVRNCTVAYSPCAGIEGAEDEFSLVENNTIYGNGLTQIHFANSRNNTIRYNLIYGVRRPVPPGAKSSFNTNGYGSGIELMCELWYDGDGWDYGHLVYGNSIANTKLGIRIGYQTGANRNYPNNKTSNFKIFNNTVIQPSHIETGSQFGHALAVLGSDDTYGYNHLGTGHVIKNNIFWQEDGGIDFGYTNSNKVDIGCNLWSKKPSDSFQRSSDPTNAIGYSTLNIADYFAKTSGWNNIVEGSLDKSDFLLLPTAVFAIGKAITPSDLLSDIAYLNSSIKKSEDIGASFFIDSGSAKTLEAPRLDIVCK